MELTAFAERYAVLQQTMEGFDGLILVLQALLTQWSLAVGEVWESDHDTTLAIAAGLADELVGLVEYGGVEA